MNKRHCLPRLPGTIRDTAYAATEREIKDTLKFIARQHNCSVSFVLNTIIADALNIKVPVRYYDYRKVTGKAKKTA
jgi:hypothetical protein